MIWLLEILGSAGFGSIIGGVFGYLTKREERANMEMKLNHEIKLIEARTAATTEVAKLNMEQAEIAGRLMVERIEADAFKESQESGGVVSETLKSIVRPLILGLLMYQTYRILEALEELSGGLENFSPDEAMALYRIVVLSVTGLTATAVGWYYAARSSKQFDKLLDKWTFE